MNDNDVKKALECCKVCSSPEDCYECPYSECDTKKGCVGDLINDSLDLINRLQAENERLTGYNENLQTANTALSNEILETKFKTRRDFADRLKAKKHQQPMSQAEYFGYSKAKDVVDVDEIDNTLKELEGEENNEKNTYVV